MRTVTIRLTHFAAAALLLAGSGCGELDRIASYDPITDPAQLFMALTLNHHAINLALGAPYDQVQLVATPRNALGAPLSGLPPVKFTSADTTSVWVGVDGRVQARRAVSNLRVIAEIVTADNIRRADTAWVNVRSTLPVPQVTTFSIQPATPEASVWAMDPLFAILGHFLLRPAGINLQPRLRLSALDSNGMPVTGLQVHYTSLDPDVVSLNSRFGSVSTHGVGQARLVASTSAFGVTLSDTATFTVTLPRVHAVSIEMRADSSFVLNPSGVVIRTGGYVFWANFSQTPIAVTFDNPAVASEIPEVCAFWGGANCGAGNIPAFDGTNGQVNGIRGRQFNTAGTYTFNTSNGLTGQIVVSDDDTP